MCITRLKLPSILVCTGHGLARLDVCSPELHAVSTDAGLLGTITATPVQLFDLLILWCVEP